MIVEFELRQIFCRHLCVPIVLSEFSEDLALLCDSHNLTYSEARFLGERDNRFFEDMSKYF